MPISPWRALSPDNGDHYLFFERPFRYVVEDPEHTWRRVWIPTVIACPVCEADSGLRLAFKTGVDVVVEAACLAGHIWVEPRVDVSQWMAYCRFRAGRQEPDWLWLIEAGFGEEPPPPIDYVEEVRQGAAEAAKYGKRKAKAKLRRKVRKVKKKVGKRVRNEAMRPVAAVLRTAWAVQAGGVEPVKSSRRRPAEPKLPKTPPVSAYRKAYGVPAPEKGPKCLVCGDSGRITAPGISIPCPECAGPAAAALAAAERRVERVRQAQEERRSASSGRGAGRSRPAAAPATGSVTAVHGDNEQAIVNRATPGRPLTGEDTKVAREAAERAVQETSGNPGVRVHGRNNSVITSVTSDTP
ncbi:hypothetical protein [Streptomyces misionensis]|uniref:hypothetical protein n=1 Tax=Streptomyces misionensis TaxID=67331 RepID=UPI0033F3689C